MKGMKRYIDTTKEMRQKAMKLFGVTEQTVFNAIGFDSRRGDTATAKRIRSYLLQNGGCTMVKLPEVETIHDADGYMRQYFPNGSILEIDKNTGDTAIYFNGEKLVSFDNLFIWQLESLQHVAMSLKASDVGQFADPTFRERWKRGVILCRKDQYIKNEEQRPRSKVFGYPS